MSTPERDLAAKIKEEVDAMSIGQVKSVFNQLRCKLPNLDSFEELKYFFVSQRLIETEQLPDNNAPCPSKVNWMWFLIPLAFLFWRK